MVDPYNLTALNGADSIFSLVTVANDYSGSLLMGLFVIAVFAISLLVLKKYEFDFALLSSSFGTFVISGLLTYAGILNIMYPLAFLAILSFTAFYVFVVKND